MKSCIPFHWLALLACLISLSAGAYAGDAGTIKTVRGKVTLERQGKSADTQVGDAVYAGDRVRVIGDGSVGISMRDETLLSAGPNSTLVIDNYAYNPTTREGQVETSILKGTLRFVTGLIGRANPSAIKVSTPTATVGIRGTDFIVEVPDEN
jgi:hypothetical protein